MLGRLGALGWIAPEEAAALETALARLAALQQIGRLASDRTIDPAEAGAGLVRLVLSRHRPGRPRGPARSPRRGGRAQRRASSPRGSRRPDAAHRLSPRLSAAAEARLSLADGQARLPARRAGRPRPPAGVRRPPGAGAALGRPRRRGACARLRRARREPDASRPPSCGRSACPTPPPSPAAPSSPPPARCSPRGSPSSTASRFNLAGGAHHAGPEGGAGFCVFNDVAIAAQALLDEGRVSRVLVVDCDVHQGDGTARIFAGRRDVLTLSLHAERNYPARKAASHLDFPLPDAPRRPRLPRDPRPRAGRHRALPARPRLLQRRRRSARRGPPRPPGADRRGPARPRRPGDRLGAIARTALAAVLGGGYDDDPVRLAARHAILFEEAARLDDPARRSPH